LVVITCRKEKRIKDQQILEQIIFIRVAEL
jgi:hypothetical protein